MRYFLPPAPGGRPRPRLRPVEPAGAEGPPGRRAPEPGGPDPDGLLVRVLRMEGGAARDHATRWTAEEPAAWPIPAPPGVSAWERARPGRAGGPRRQRLAVAARGPDPRVGHWSAPEPVAPADERAWRILLRRLAGDRGRGGWTA
jgi:hypothetical protein